MKPIFLLLAAILITTTSFYSKFFLSQDDSKAYIHLQDGTNTQSVCHAGRIKNLYNSHPSKTIEVLFSVSDSPTPITASVSSKENKFIGCLTGAENKPVTYKIIGT